jgi:CBS domain-containing protein
MENNIDLLEGYHMKVNEIMTKKPCFIAEGTNLTQAAALMQKHNCGALLVGTETDLQGILTDRDITVKAVADGLSLDSTTVKKVMSRHVKCCSTEDSIKSALEKMERNHILRLAVCDKNNRVVGVISHGDIAKAALRDKAEYSSIAHEFIEVARAA